MSDPLNRLSLIDDADIVLDEAALSLALLDHPGIELDPYEDLLEEMAVRLKLLGKRATTAREQADALSSVISDEFSFVGDRQTYDDPANADLIQVIDRRKGLPISLSILYVAAARRIGWRANVLDVPGHVLVHLGPALAPVLIDPFHGGIFIEGHHLASLLKAQNGGTAPVVWQVSVMPNRAVLIRLLLNQAMRAKQGGDGQRALELFGRITAMAPAYGHAWWERARLELSASDAAAARNSLVSMLEVTREPALRRQVADTLAAIAAP